MGSPGAVVAPPPRKLASFVLLTALYLGLNSTLNLANKWALGMYGFKFPLLLTCCHMLFSFLALLPFMLSRSMMAKHEETLRRQWKGFVAIGLFMALNISLNNSSLVEMTLSLNQVIRASIPVFTCLLAIGIEGKVPTRGEAASLLILTSGVMLAVWDGAVAGSPRGILLCLAGTVSNALMMTTSGKVLSEKVDVLRLTFYTAPISMTALTPFFLAREYSRFTVDYMPLHGADVYTIVLATSAVALSYNVVHSLMIQQTSAVTTTVLGEVKIVGLMVLSYALLGESKAFTPTMTAGCLTAVGGFCLYSHFKLVAAGGGSGSGAVGADVQLARQPSEYLARLGSPERGGGAGGGAGAGERVPLRKPMEKDASV